MNAPHVDALVIGSGFGGAVTAARLAQAGLSVTILERGRRWQPGDFPRSPGRLGEWLWKSGRGLVDLRWLDSMLSIHGAGWGGGSLIYANVFARPAEGSHDRRWPAELRRQVLDPYFDLAGTMLGVGPVQPDPATGRVPARTKVFEDLVETMDIGAATVRPNLAVNFDRPDAWMPNEHGVPQRGCAFVGECVLGCNRGAKNSLDTNYLAVAERNGARAITHAEVVRIEPLDEGWSVWALEGEGTVREEVRHTADRVFLAAGSVATTELLLRARDIDRTLPELSPALGHGFSGNGDFLATGNLKRRRPGRRKDRGRKPSEDTASSQRSDSSGESDGDLTRGPTITTTTVLDVWERSAPVWFQVQDGAIPQPISAAIDEALPLRRLRRAWARLRHQDPKRSVAFLSMGHDAGNGRLRLDDTGEVRLDWANRWQSRLYRAEGRVGPAVARHLGAGVRSLPLWSLFRRAITVHPLGGVPVGADRATGVVGADHQVHGYPGLFVMDGAVVPASTGANPSATILAVAEMTIERIIRDITGERAWRAPEWSRVRKLPVPEDAAYRWMAARREATAGDGVVVDERMRERGAGSAGSGDPSTGGRGLDVRLTVPGLDAFRADPEHAIGLTGHLELSALPGRSAVSGWLRLFPRSTGHLMDYELNVTDAEGRTWTGTGSKLRQGRGPVARYRSLTRMGLVLTPKAGPSAGPESESAYGPEPVSATITTELVLTPTEVLRMAGSMHGVGFTRGRRMKAVTSFLTFFAYKALARPSTKPARSRRTAASDASIEDRVTASRATASARISMET